MAQEVPANEHPARDRHQFQTLILAIALLLTVLLAVLAVIFAAPWLNDYGFLHFPLGFYLLAQGLLRVGRPPPRRPGRVALVLQFPRHDHRPDRDRDQQPGHGPGQPGDPGVPPAPAPRPFEAPDPPRPDRPTARPSRHARFSRASARSSSGRRRCRPAIR